MSIANLQRQILAERQKILDEIEAEQKATRNAAAKAIQEAKDAAKAAKEAEKAAKAAQRAAATAARAPKPQKTRKRGAGANWEIAGRPAALGPGAPLRRVEGNKRYSQNAALRRSRRKRSIRRA